MAANVPLNLFDKMELGFDWSPNGREVVWPILVQGQVRLALVDVDGDKLLRTLPTQGSASDPRSLQMGDVLLTHQKTRPMCVEFASSQWKERGPRRYAAKGIRKGPIRPISECRRCADPLLSLSPSGKRRDKGARDCLAPWWRWHWCSSGRIRLLDPVLRCKRFCGIGTKLPKQSGVWAELVTGATGKDITADVVAAADYLKGLKEVDPARIVVFGASFGGYAVLRTITSHPHVFVAAVDVSGPCDLTVLYQEIPTSRLIMTAMLGGSPEQSAQRYREESPIYQADRIAIPLLVIHGTADENYTLLAKPTASGRFGESRQALQIDHVQGRARVSERAVGKCDAKLHGVSD